MRQSWDCQGNSLKFQSCNCLLTLRLSDNLFLLCWVKMQRMSSVCDLETRRLRKEKQVPVGDGVSVCASSSEGACTCVYSCACECPCLCCKRRSRKSKTEKDGKVQISRNICLISDKASTSLLTRVIYVRNVALDELLCISYSLKCWLQTVRNKSFAVIPPRMSACLAEYKLSHNSLISKLNMPLIFDTCQPEWILIKMPNVPCKHVSFPSQHQYSPWQFR